MSGSHARLQQRLGYQFRDPALLQRALTHRSVGAGNNERLEFLGDGLLNFVVAQHLYQDRPRAEEGALTRLRASLVREETLAQLARELQLSEALHLGESELKSGGFRRDSILADALEAILGAIFLDSGYETARDTCLRWYTGVLQTLPDPESLKDPKTRLQEWLQAQSRPLPLYEVLAESGPAHRRRFQVQCRLLDGPQSAQAEGSSRRNAEQQAAETLLQELKAVSHA